MSRVTNHLFPLEIPYLADSQLEDTHNTTTNKDNIGMRLNRRCSLRNAADDARRKIAKQLSSEVTTVVFSFPQECHEEKAI